MILRAVLCATLATPGTFAAGTFVCDHGEYKTQETHPHSFSLGLAETLESTESDQESEESSTPDENPDNDALFRIAVNQKNQPEVSEFNFKLSRFSDSRPRSGIERPPRPI